MKMFYHNFQSNQIEILFDSIKMKQNNSNNPAKLTTTTSIKKTPIPET
jgi:hypothetical protein